MNKTLFLFIDESGNLDFSKNGTKYFVLSCLSTFTPSKERERFVKLKYFLLAQGVDQEFFHATEDTQYTRDLVFKFINSLSDDIEVHSVIAQKNKANPRLYIENYLKKGIKIRRTVGSEFYQRVCRTLLQYVFRRSNFKNAEKIVVVLGSIFTHEKQSLIIQTLKKYLKENFEMPFEIYFHSSKADINSQLADYVGWAITIKWERNEDRSYKLIFQKVKSEYEIFKNGQTSYY